VPDITSRQHPIVQAFRRAARGEGDQVLLDGWHLLHEAADAQLALTTVAFVAGLPTPGEAARLEQLSHHCDVFTVTTAVMDAMSPVRTPAGVVALAERRHYTLEDLVRPHPALLIVAANVQDPGNAGAIVRSVEAGGGTGVLFAGQSADPWSWKSLRAAMGSTFRLPVDRTTTLTSALDALRAASVTVVASVPRGGCSLPEMDLRGAVALVVGAEGAGLDEDIIAAADATLTIPMKPPVESLNVAVAAALLTYEARRQREA
jgi:TrmH family RNA methyltransferase